VDFTSTAEVGALTNNYLRAFKPGVQAFPFPASGDLAANGGGFAPSIEGVASAARVSSTGACVADPAGGCPLPPAPVGGFRWTFGDSTAAVTPPQAFARAWFSPFIAHRYCQAGTYQLTVSTSDQQGQTDTMTLPVHVYPPLRVTIVRRGRTATAHAAGGDGVMLSYVWSLPGSKTAFTPAIAAPSRGRLTVTVSDAAGGTASASTVSAAPPARRAC
jgi:hypothetical protein